MRGIDVKRLRKEMKLSQKEFADTVGVSRPMISQIESDKKSVSDELELKIVEVFNMCGGTASVEAKIDFLRIRFKTHDVETIISKILHMDMNWFVHEQRGFYKYTETFYFGSIRIFRNPQDVNMGTMIDLSGEGCRQLEQIFEEDNERTWTEFFWSLYEDDLFGRGVLVDTKVTRIDIALDELIVSGEENFDLHLLKNKMESGLVSTSFKNFDDRGGMSWENKKWINKGLTLYFGSRQSPLHFCFYQKDYDFARKEKISVEEARLKYRVKNRYEIRLADEKAFLFLEYFLSSGESLDFLVKELINESLSVYEIKNGHRVFCQAWYNVIDKMKGLKLSVKGEKPSIEKTLRWLTNYLAPSLKMIKVIDNLIGTDELRERIEVAELKDKHYEMIEMVCTDTKELLMSDSDLNDIKKYVKESFGLSKEMDEVIEEEEYAYPF
ncbi:replication initiation factor domain-containing protein [Enterococcus sp. LJL128]